VLITIFQFPSTAMSVSNVIRYSTGGGITHLAAPA
jgi:hypothetical protein